MRKAFRWTLTVVAGMFALLVAAASVFLSPGISTRIANNAVASFVDGSARIGRLNVSILKHFPDVSVEIDSLTIACPHDTFASLDTLSSWGVIERGMMDAGRGDEADTLVSVNHLSARMNVMAFLTKKVIRISEASLDGLRAFAHIYNDSTANWSIIKIPESKDTVSSPLPSVEVTGIRITGIQELVLTCPASALFTKASFKEFNLNGKVKIGEEGISADAGISLDAGTRFQMGDIGLIDAPISLAAGASVTHSSDGTGIDLRGLAAQAASIPVEASGLFLLKADSTYVKASAAIGNCPIGHLMDEYGRFLPAALHGLKTDATVTVKAEADGWFGSASGLLPLLKAELIVPDSHIAYEGLVEDGGFDMTLLAETDSDGRLNADLEDFCFDIKGVSLNITGKGADLLGDDPKFDSIKAFACTEFADLVKYLPPESGIKASGDVDFEVEGGFSLSQLTPQNIHTSDLKGHIFSDGVNFSIAKDTLYAYASHPDIRLSTKGHRILVGAGMDSVRFISGATTYIMGTAIALEASNNGRLMSGSGKIQPIFADLDIESFNMRGTDTLTIGIRNSCNKLTLGDIAEDGSVSSNVSVTSSNRMAYMRSGPDRVTLADPEVSVSLQKRASTGPANGLRREGRPRRDSLFRSERTVPDYLKDIDFRKKDIRIDIGEGLSKLFRKWKPSAEVSFSLGSVATPVLPLRNSITSFDGRFNGDKLELDNFLINSGTTRIGFRGTLSGLEPILLGRSSAPLDATVTIHSRLLNLNELLAALKAGEGLKPADDDDYIVDGLENAEEQLDFTALVVPANLNANLTVDIDSVRYSRMALSGFSSRARMRERCLQITNTTAGSEFGNVTVDGFYSSMAKDDISAGFNVKLSSITADRIITLLPAVDSIVPMLKSFKGSLNCEMTATTKLDPDMNVIFPSLNGAVKLNGTGLELSDTGDLRRIAQILRFKDVNVGHIDDLTVNCIVADNQLQVFPFILGVDRYTLGLSGVQGFDQRFKYHISVIKSPLPFKFGINLRGTFDNWGFTLGRPKYKSTDIPLFSPEVDTLQVNLASAIKNIFQKGVDAAVREYARERLRISSMRDIYGLYEDNEFEELSNEELDRFDSYMLDIECEAESEAIEKEIEEMLDRDLFENIMAGLAGTGTDRD